LRKNRLNILLIHTDQQRADTMGCYGNSIVQTPHLDMLAQSGVTFLNAHCTHPLCSPSRASWVTGEYIHSHCLWRNGCALPERRDNVVKSLKNAGYHTAAIGKVHLTPYHGDPAIHPESMHLDNPVRKPAEQECWDYWRNEKFANGYYGYEDVRLSIGHGDYGMTGGHYGLWVHEKHPEALPLFLRENALSGDTTFDAWRSAVPLEVHSATWIANQTEDYLKNHSDAPFFLSVGFQEPHPPFQPPQPYCDMYNPEDIPEPVGKAEDWGENSPEFITHYLTRQGLSDLTMKRKKEILALYYGMVSLVDDAVGRILDSLERFGLADNTVVIFTSDHGDWMGDHGLNRKGCVHTRGLSRIPLIIRWPGVAHEGLRVEAVSSQIDIAATMYDIAGEQPHYTNQGKSLRSVLCGETDRLRDYALIEHCHEHYWENGAFENNIFGDTLQHKRKLAVQDDIINHTDRDIVIKTVVTDDYRFTYVPAIGYGELYDLHTDINECNNLYGTDLRLQEKAVQQLLTTLVETSPRCQERTYGV